MTNSRREKYYIDVGRASDLESVSERIIYRALEIMPGFLAWLTLILMVVFSWVKPAWAAYFIIAFCFYWFLRIGHFSFHLIASYRQMAKNLKMDWLKKLDSWDRLGARNRSVESIEGWKDVFHLIIFPMYKEDLFLVRETFRSLSKCFYPKDKMIVVLATEERAGNGAQDIAEKIEKEFGKKFYKFLATCHPQNIPGELAGKGSNETWAAKIAKKEIIDSRDIPYENIIVSALDIDTQIFPHYFGCLTYHYLTAENPLRSSFQPIPLYLNNVWEVPFFSRLVAFSNIFWQALQQQRPEKLVTFSSHSMSFKALSEMNFWQINVVSEDAGIFWKSFLFYDGDYRIIPLQYPVSMDCVKNKNLKETVISQYKQQRRWAWGSEGIPYLFFGFLKNGKIPFKSKARYGFLLIEGFWAWATNAILIFFLGWLPLFLGGKEFGSTLLAYNLPVFTKNLMTLALFGLVICAAVSFRLLSFSPFPKNYFKIFSAFLQWAFLPFTFLFFGALPAIDAQTRLMLGRYMGFYVTEKVREKRRKSELVAGRLKI